MVQENTPTCQEEELHPEAIHRVREKLPQDEVLYDLAELFKIFGDSTRVKILYALLEAEELCVCDIASLMKFRKEGKTVYYSLADDHVCRILSQGMEHICE